MAKEKLIKIFREKSISDNGVLLCLACQRKDVDVFKNHPEMVIKKRYNSRFYKLNDKVDNLKISKN